MALMKDTQGNEHEIVPAGVAALQHLGWEVLIPDEPPVDPDDGEDPSSGEAPDEQENPVADEAQPDEAEPAEEDAEKDEPEPKAPAGRRSPRTRGKASKEG